MFAYNLAYGISRNLARTTVCPCGNGSLERSGDGPRADGVRDGLRWIAATGEYGPMHGVIGRVRLLSPRSAPGTYGDGGAAGHVSAVKCVRRLDPNLGAEPRDAVCYNFLYCIKDPPKAVVPSSGPPRISTR